MKRFSFLIIVALALHLIWENAQAPLFVGYISFSQHFLACLVGTIGDGIFTVLVYLGVGVLKNDFNWISRLRKEDILVSAIIGFFFAVGIEQRALLAGSWSYAEGMPIVPYLRVGLLPILQMTLLLPLSFYLTFKWSKS